MHVHMYVCRARCVFVVATGTTAGTGTGTGTGIGTSPATVLRLSLDRLFTVWLPLCHKRRSTFGSVGEERLRSSV